VRGSQARAGTEIGLCRNPKCGHPFAQHMPRCQAKGCGGCNGFVGGKAAAVQAPDDPVGF
jgi:hypothetical protein